MQAVLAEFIGGAHGSQLIENSLDCSHVKIEFGSAEACSRWQAFCEIKICFVPPEPCNLTLQCKLFERIHPSLNEDELCIANCPSFFGSCYNDDRL